MHSLIPFGWMAFSVSLLQAPAWAEPPSLPPNKAVALALSAHPDLHAAEAAASIARADRSRSAVLLANPNVSGWTSTDGARAELGLTQPLSLTGEGWHARTAARSSLDEAASSLARRRRVVAARTRLAYVDAVVATGLVGVASEGSDLAGRLSFAVRRKHEEGEASALDLRLAHLAEVQAATRLLRARRNEAEAVRALASWVAQPVTAQALLEDPAEAAPSASATGSSRSDVQAAEAAVARAEAELRRARAAAVPPVSVGARVAIEDGQTFIGPSVSLPLPLFDRNQQGRAASKGRLAVAEGQLQQVRARAETEQSTAAQRVAEADTAADRVQADIEEARAALASIEAGVLAGEIDLPTAVLLQTQVLDGEAAVVQLQGLVADARIDLLLATDDDALLGGAP
jgi:cobalt-zinc-cadmium efflux system outer membrane protein